MDTLKIQLMTLANVLPEKQKIMIKGKVVKDGDDLTNFAGLKEGATIMMMGTAEEHMLVAPEKPVKFLEDMTPEERARALNEKQAVVLTAGLDNLGNTCYLNSVLQCLKRIDELKKSLKEVKAPAQASDATQDHIFTMAAGGLMKGIEQSEYAYQPMQFVSLLRQNFPLFDQRDQQGHHQQQDADEALNTLLNAWRQPLAQANERDLIGDLFEFEMKAKLTNTELPEEVTESSERVLKLRCEIDNNNNPVSSMDEGIKISLAGQLEKNSQTLGRDVVWNKTSAINNLPKYLCV